LGEKENGGVSMDNARARVFGGGGSLNGTNKVIDTLSKIPSPPPTTTTKRRGHPHVELRVRLPEALARRLSALGFRDPGLTLFGYHIERIEEATLWAEYQQDIEEARNPAGLVVHWLRQNAQHGDPIPRATEVWLRKHERRRRFETHISECMAERIAQLNAEDADGETA
jgi:hypothetical protein